MQRSFAFEVLQGRLSDAQTELDKALKPLPDLIQEDVWNIFGQSSGAKRPAKRDTSRSPPPKGRSALSFVTSNHTAASDLASCTKRLRQHVKNYPGLPLELVEDLAGLFKALGLSTLESPAPLNGMGGGTGETADTGNDNMAIDYTIPPNEVVRMREVEVKAAARAPPAPVVYPSSSRKEVASPLSGNLPPPPGTGTEPNSPVPTPPGYPSGSSKFSLPPVPGQSPESLSNLQLGTLPPNVLAALASHVTSLPGQVQTLDEDNRSHVSDESC